jgi:PTS system nitrogen regulatory IIA component
MRLADFTSQELVFTEVPGSDTMTVLRAISDRLEARGVVEDGDELYRRLWEREKLGSTGIGSEVAIPHCKMEDVDRVRVAVALCPQGVDFGACDSRPVRLLFTVISPVDSAAVHLHSLSAISRWVRAEDHLKRILRLDDPAAIFELLRETEAEAQPVHRG